MKIYDYLKYEYGDSMESRVEGKGFLWLQIKTIFRAQCNNLIGYNEGLSQLSAQGYGGRGGF